MTTFFAPLANSRKGLEPIGLFTARTTSAFTSATGGTSLGEYTPRRQAAGMLTSTVSLP